MIIQEDKTVIQTSTIRSHYFLKEELINYCKVNHLPTSGSKEMLINRIAYFLETGKILVEVKEKVKRAQVPNTITNDTIIEENFVCTQKHRVYFEHAIGPTFKFKVAFQTWLKQHAGKTYQDALVAYEELRVAQKHTPTIIGKQFEYNTYIRAFFEANKGKTLQEAIQCWNYKKSFASNHRYEDRDLQVLEISEGCTMNIRKIKNLRNLRLFD